MKKIIILTCLFFYFIKGYALAFSCNLNKYQIGKSLSNFDEEKKIFLYREILNGIGSITIPIEYPCKETEANGTIIVSLYSLIFAKRSLDMPLELAFIPPLKNPTSKLLAIEPPFRLSVDNSSLLVV